MYNFGMKPEGLVIGTRRVHYAWIIVAVATVMWMTSSSLRFAVAILVPEFEELFGWSIGFITLGFTIQWLVSATLSPICGWLSDRYGVRRVMWAGGFLFMFGMVMTGIMTELWEFYLYFGLVLAAGMASFQVTLVSGVTLWFRRNLGLVMGVLQGLQGLGTGLAILMVYLLFDQYGLQVTFWIPGIAGGIILLTLTRWFFNEPADRGITQWGAPADEPVRRLQNNAVAKMRTGVFLKQVQKTFAFWNLAVIHGLGCAGHNIILILLVAIAIDDGISSGVAAMVYLTLTVVSTATRFATPVIADIIGSKWVMVVCFGLQTLPIMILFVAGDSVALYFVFAILFGIGMGGEMTAFPIINRQYYADAPTATAYGWQMMGAGLGMALGPVSAGFLRDITGSYFSSLWLSFGLSVLAVVAILFLPNTKRLQLPDWEEALPPEARGNVARSEASRASEAPAAQPAAPVGATGDGDGD
jgi:MFS family permease